MSEVRVNNLSNENNTGGPTISGITTYSGRHFFVPPQGDTASRPEDCEPGSFRFNTDSAKLEYFRGNNIGWVEIEAELTEPLGGGTGSNTGLGTRGLILAGDPSTVTIEFFTVSTLGNAQDFGDLTQDRKRFQGFASRTRAFGIGGQANNGASGYNVIDFVTVSSTGNAQDFGDQTTQTRSQIGLSNSTRGITAGGTSGFPSGTYLNTIEYVTMQAAGNTVDFGDLTVIRDFPTGVNSSVRAIIAGGNQYPTNYNVIDFITTASTGNAQDFGDLSISIQVGAAVCNSTRGVIALTYGGSPVGYKNTMEFITMATTGNSIDFGDRTHTATPQGGASSPIRGVFAGGYASPGPRTNAMEFIEITTTGNAKDFGDMVTARGMPSTVSNGHGGLSG